MSAGSGPPRRPDEPATGGVPGGAGPSPAAGDPAAGDEVRAGGAAGGEAAGDPGRMAAIQRGRAARERAAGDEAARAAGPRESVAGRAAERPSVRTRWRLREAASDLGARDRLARMFDRGRDRAGGVAVRDGASAGGATPTPTGAAPATGHPPGPAGGARGDRRRGAASRGRGGDDGSREASMVPRAEFESYYGRPVLKPPVWKDDIAYYFFLGGLAAGSSLLAAGADQRGLPALRRGSRIGALVSLAGGTFFLIHDLGRPDRFHHMLRVAKPTSPMSVGTWVLAAYAPGMGLAAAGELLPARLRATPVGRLVDLLARPAGLAAAALAPAVASYTAVLLSQTAVPAWHESQEELPFIFTASAAASAGGLGMIVAPPEQAAPARRLAAYGAVIELAASRRLENRVGVLAEAFTGGDAGRYLDRASTLTAAGVLGSMLLGRRSRIAAVASGAALLAGGVFERLGLLHAGVRSTADPRYVVGPQRERIEQHGPTRVAD